MWIDIPGRLHQAAEPQDLQLELRDGGRGRHGRPAHSLSARPHAGRLDRRSTACSMCAASRSTTTPGASSATAAGRTRRSCPTSRSRSISSAAATTAAARAARSTSPTCASTHELCDAFIDAAEASGFPQEQGLQQRRPGRLRLLPGDDEERQALVDGARLPRPGARAAQPQDRDRCAGRQDPARGQARGRRRLQRARPEARGAGQPRGHRVVRLGAVARRARAFRHRPARAAAQPRHRGEARAEGRRRELRRPLRAAHELARQACRSP